MNNGRNITKVELLNLKEVEGFYIFGDIRGFSKWANNNLSEVAGLLEITYSLAPQIFGDSTRRDYRVVKFLGDGFFAVREYVGRTKVSFKKNLIKTINNMIEFKQFFLKELSSSILHEKDKLGISFGLSYGISRRFNLPGFALDYVGDKINLASRLCSLARPSDFVIEHDLKEYILEFIKDKFLDLQKSSDKKPKIKGFGTRNVFIINEISKGKIEELVFKPYFDKDRISLDEKTRIVFLFINNTPKIIKFISYQFEAYHEGYRIAQYKKHIYKESIEPNQVHERQFGNVDPFKAYFAGKRVQGKFESKINIEFQTGEDQDIKSVSNKAVLFVE